jgi:hypothetical protein
MSEDYTDDYIIKLKLEKLAALENKIRDAEQLPHRHLFKYYPWAREYFDDVKTRMQVVCSGNQAGKSSFQVRKCIELAGNKELWKEAFPMRTKFKVPPNLFLYFYPDLKLATTEWHFKWKQFMPTCKDDPTWGWHEVFDQRKQIFEVRFNSGITVQFRGYSQDAISLQAVTPDAIFIDEEPPWVLMPEIIARLNASNGLFSAAFTATLGQEEWERIVEKRTLWEEAKVQQVSLFDCMYYEDGSASHWTKEAIDQVIKRCATEKDVQMRVFGRFVKSDNLIYPNFTTNNRCSVEALLEIRPEWPRFAGIDYGGGGSSHPSAISFIAVKPDFSKGYVYKFWRGDGIITTAQDVLLKYIDMKAEDQCWFAFFDWAAKDLGTIAERSGQALIKAEKSHDIGEGVLNSLFKNNMLYIPYGEEFDKLASEINNLNRDIAKKDAKDDGIDSLRYACSKIPWHYEKIEIAEEPKPKTEVDLRRDMFKESSELLSTTDAELDYWGEMFDN